MGELAVLSGIGLAAAVLGAVLLRSFGALEGPVVIGGSAPAEGKVYLAVVLVRGAASVSAVAFRVSNGQMPFASSRTQSER